MVKPRERAFKQFKSPVLNVLSEAIIVQNTLTVANRVMYD